MRLFDASPNQGDDLVSRPDNPEMAVPGLISPRVVLADAVKVGVPPDLLAARIGFDAANNLEVVIPQIFLAHFNPP
jgi:hypothetical protein